MPLTPVTTAERRGPPRPSQPLRPPADPAPRSRPSHPPPTRTLQPRPPPPIPTPSHHSHQSPPLQPSHAPPSHSSHARRSSPSSYPPSLPSPDVPLDDSSHSIDLPSTQPDPYAPHSRRRSRPTLRATLPPHPLPPPSPPPLPRHLRSTLLWSPRPLTLALLLLLTALLIGLWWSLSGWPFMAPHPTIIKHSKGVVEVAGGGRPVVMTPKAGYDRGPVGEVNEVRVPATDEEIAEEGPPQEGAEVEEEKAEVEPTANASEAPVVAASKKSAATKPDGEAKAAAEEAVQAEQAEAKRQKTEAIVAKAAADTQRKAEGAAKTKGAGDDGKKAEKGEKAEKADKAEKPTAAAPPPVAAKRAPPRVPPKPTKAVDRTPPPAPLTSLKANPVMAESTFPRADDGVQPQISEPSSRQYSSFYCVGGRGREGAGKDRSCRWQNLCYQPSTATWQFHQPNTSQGQLPILLDHGRVIAEFPSDFIDLTTAAGGKDAVQWAPQQVYGEIPPSAFVPRKLASIPDVYLLYSPHYGANIGRVIADDFFSLFNVQLSFALLSNSHILLQATDCDTQFQATPKKQAQCKAIMDGVAGTMSTHPPLSVVPGLADLARAQGLKDLVCFENVLAGTGAMGFVNGLGRAPQWWRFHAFVLENLGFAHNHAPKQQRISVALMTGDRAIVNQQEVVEHLTTMLPDVWVEGVELHALSFKEQVAHLLDTTVLITITGEKATPALFLPQNAVVLFVDFWDVKTGEVAATDDRLWSNLGYLRPMWYPFQEDEVVLDAGLSRDKPADVRDYGKVKVDLERMEDMVRQALAHVEAFMLRGQE